MNFWKELNKAEKDFLSSINQYNAKTLRKESQFCASLIETAKISMNVGRTNRAWAYLILAKKYWNSIYQKKY